MIDIESRGKRDMRRSSRLCMVSLHDLRLLPASRGNRVLASLTEMAETPRLLSGVYVPLKFGADSLPQLITDTP